MKYTYFINEITVLFVQIYLQNYKTYQTMCVKKMRKSIFFGSISIFSDGLKCILPWVAEAILHNTKAMQIPVECMNIMAKNLIEKFSQTHV